MNFDLSNHIAESRNALKKDNCWWKVPEITKGEAYIMHRKCLADPQFILYCFRNMTSKEKNSFLKLVNGVESNNNRDTRHSTIEVRNEKESKARKQYETVSPNSIFVVDDISNFMKD